MECVACQQHPLSTSLVLDFSTNCHYYPGIACLDKGLAVLLQNCLKRLNSLFRILDVEPLSAILFTNSVQNKKAFSTARFCSSGGGCGLPNPSLPLWADPLMQTPPGHVTCHWAHYTQKSNANGA